MGFGELVPFPFTDIRSKKVRPALVLRDDGVHGGRDVIVCAVTRNLEDAAFSVLVDPDDLVEGRIPATSRIKAAKLMTMDRSIARKRIGRLGPAMLDRVRGELRAALRL